MSPPAEQVERGIRSQTVATEGLDEHWSPNEAEAILHQLANAFISSNPMFRANPEVRGARSRLARARTEVEAVPIDDAPFRESGLLTVDTHGLVRSGVGGAASKLLSLSEASLIGTPVSHYFVGGAPESSQRAVGVRGDGSTFDLAVTVTTLTGTDLSVRRCSDDLSLKNERERSL